MTSTSSVCDVVVPVYNGLTYVRDCVESVLAQSTDVDYRLWLIDDCSDAHTADFLESVRRAHAHIHLHRNPANQGFVRSCNTGMRLGRARYVVLLNSDVIVTTGWLSRLIRCADSDPRIGAVNPFTNYASNISIPMSPGANFHGMDHVLRQHAPCSYPDVVTGVGFCMLLRRSALEAVGPFDEAFGQGYCEDSDLCMRLTTRGWRTVVADDVYVYHKGRASFADRDERYRINRQIFDRRWAKEYRRQFRAFRAADPLRPTRELFQLPKRWDPIPCMRETYRRMRRAWRERQPFGLVREALRGVRHLPACLREVVTAESVARVTRPGRLRVTYVLPSLSLAGGVLSVVQLVNELILLGVEARIAALQEYPEIYNWRFLTRPIIFRNPQELAKDFPESDIAVATHWDSAAWVTGAAQVGRARQAVYFLQDYEAWFFPESQPRAREQVKETYRLIPHKIVKSDWLRDLLAGDGYPAHKIRLGMDLGIFYPRAVPRSPHPRVIAMARPRTPRRGFPHVIEALRRVKAARPDAEIVLFGDDLSGHTIPFSYVDQGMIFNQQRLAELYSSAHVFLDGSDFQGFGRPALEAMACGCACVLTNVGGVSEYARDSENCSLVPPGRPDLFAAAILQILDEAERRERYVSEGFRTVQAFCHKREARETLAYFHTVLAGSSSLRPRARPEGEAN